MALALLCALTVVAVPRVAWAAESETTSNLAEHVEETVTPSGTSFGLFDYWIDGEGANDNKGPGAGLIQPNEGINDGHQLKFVYGTGAPKLNEWTGVNGVPRYGIVSPVLSGGFPSLQENEALGITSAESLQYLFSPSGGDYKRAYTGVTGLLQVVDGYYVYDSQKNFASYDKATNSFDVYDSYAIHKNVEDAEDAGTTPSGQFFPFNSAEQVFKTTSDGQYVLTDGKLTPDPDIKSMSTKLQGEGDNKFSINHFFGLSMTSRFVQPEKGMTSENSPMSFYFSGDDDAWLYIDDVLIGDVGGIHDACYVEVDFSTGKVTTGNSKLKASGTEGNKRRETTLRECFEKAGKSKDQLEVIFGDGNTFKDQSEHTLKFFYLERGNVDSNLSLKFNLVTVPESEVEKVDQNGSPISGAEFKLYASDESYAVEENKLVATGTTGADGRMALRGRMSGELVSFDDLYKEYQASHFVLRETSTPPGYRSMSGDVKLKYEKQPNSESGFVVVDGGSQWETGAWAATRVKAVAPHKVYQYGGYLGTTADKKELTEEELEKGTIFAVILKRDKQIGSYNEPSAWHAVSGNAVDGYKVWDSPEDEESKGLRGVISAAQAQPYTFSLTASGSYEALIDEIPDDPRTYWRAVEDKDNDNDDIEYALGFYFTTASDISGASVGNTTRLYDPDPTEGEGQPTDGFTRTYAARIVVPNMRNVLWVQKDNGAGTYLDGAEFSLYKANGNELGDMYDTVTTRTLSKASGDLLDLEGAAMFPSGDKAKILEKGVYYLKETRAPAGHKLNETVTKVIVDDSGVHADAGVADDGVSTEVGVGWLAKSMSQFATNPELNTTLQDIIAAPQTGVLGAGDTLTWPAENIQTDKVMHLWYGGSDAWLEYGPRDEGGSLSATTDEGWLRLGIRQCLDRDHVNTDSSARHEQLDMLLLNNLFSGSTIVHVTNEADGCIEVTKQVQQPVEGTVVVPDATFEFTLTVGDGGTGSYLAHIYNIGDSGELQFVEERHIANGATFSLKDGQTARIYLPSGTAYTVAEPAEKLPEGFSLVKRLQGGQEVTAEGMSIAGTSSAIRDDGSAAEQNRLTFVNTYTPPVPTELTLEATKELRGGELVGNDFTFEVVDKTGTVVSTGTNDADGTVSFSPIAYTEAGEHVYTVREKTDSLPEGVKPVTQPYQLSVSVKNVEGTLVATPAYPEGGLAFVNVKGSPDAVIVSGIKHFELAEGSLEATWDDVREHFTFTLTGTGPDGSPAPLPEVTSVQADASGNVIFGEILFEATDLEGLTPNENGAYVFTYTVTETGSAPNVTNDPEPAKTFAVVVTQDEAGVITATAESGDDGLFSFVNTYDEKIVPPEPDPDPDPEPDPTPDPEPTPDPDPEPPAPPEPEQPEPEPEPEGPIPWVGDATSPIRAVAVGCGGALLALLALAVWRRRGSHGR